MGYERLKKKVQGKDTPNNKQSLPCRRWYRGPLLFIHLFLRFVLLLLLNNSGKLAILHNHLLLLLQIIHFALFKFCSAKASRASMGELIYHLFGTDLLWSIFDRQFRKVVLLMLQQYSKDCVVAGGSFKPFIYRWAYMGAFYIWGDIRFCYWPHRWVDGAQCKCTRWFMFWDFLWTCRVTDYFRLSCELVRWLNIAKYQALETVYRAGVRWRWKFHLWRCTNQRWGARVQTSPKNMFFHSDLL